MSNIWRLYIPRPGVAIDLYRMYRSWGRPFWRCVVDAVEIEHSARMQMLDLRREAEAKA